MIDELFLRYEPSDPLQRHFKQAELARRKLEHLIVHVADAADLVEGERAVPHDGRAATHAAPGERPHARLELVQMERLRHIVVGAEVEPFTRSSTLSAAVRINTGRVELRARNRRRTSSPDMRGKPRSSIRRSKTCMDKAASASPPPFTWSTT